MLSNVAIYYAYNEGINQQVLVADLSPSDLVSASFYTSSITRWVNFFINPEGKINTLNNNMYSMINGLNHESNHVLK